MITRIQSALPTEPAILGGLLAAHLFFATYYSLFVLLPFYLEGSPHWVLGLAVGIYGISSLVGRIVAGELTDRQARKKWMVVGLILTVVALIGYSASSSPLNVISFRILQGFGSVIFATSFITYTLDRSPVQDRGKTLGLTWIAMSSAPIWAPVTALSVARAYSFELSFFVLAVLAAAAALLILPIQEVDSAPRRQNIGRAPTWIVPSALITSLAFLTITIPFGALQAFLAPYSEKENLGDAGIFFSVFGITTISLAVAAGWLGDRLGHLWVALSSLLLAGMAMLVLGLWQSTEGFYTAGALFGVALSGGYTSLMVLTTSQADDSARGRAVATFSLSWDVGGASPLVGGLILLGVGYGGLFAILGIPSLLITSLLYRDQSSAELRPSQG